MNLENIKSFVLIILIGISLLLSFGLWTYQPDYDTLNSSVQVREADIGGEEEEKRSVISPSSIIFHGNENHFGFTEPGDREDLYNNMQTWEMDDFTTGEASGRNAQTYEVEVIFPDDLPLELLSSLFSLDDGDIEFPSWSFDRMYFTFNEQTSSLNVQIISVDGQQQANAVISNPNNYETLWNYIYTLDDLSAFVQFDEGESAIYIPKQSKTAQQHSLVVNTIEANTMVYALFDDPSLVNRNFNNGDTYYNDEQRGMRAYQYGRNMEFYNPTSESFQQMPEVELLDNSILSINDHRGWTDDYRFLNMESLSNTVRYQMYYKEYPVFNSSGLAMIEQEWRNMGLHQYRRPLFSLNYSDSVSGDEMVLPSGNEIISYLNSSTYNLENIQDIKHGYKLIYQTYESVNPSVLLEPTWYMNYEGTWVEITLEEGGSEDAMEQN
ncbi:YycH family regulatory protein [Virgibacillus ainsalahensis]